MPVQGTARRAPCGVEGGPLLGRKCRPPRLAFVYSFGRWLPGPVFCAPCCAPFPFEPPRGGGLAIRLRRQCPPALGLLRLSLAVCVLVCGLCVVCVLYIQKQLLEPISSLLKLNALGATLVVAEASWIMAVGICKPTLLARPGCHKVGFSSRCTWRCNVARKFRSPPGSPGEPLEVVFSSALFCL